MTGLPDLISTLRRRFVPELRTRGDSDAAGAIQLLHGHPAEMRDLDGSRRHCRMAQARLARIHQAARAHEVIRRPGDVVRRQRACASCG